MVVCNYLIKCQLLFKNGYYRFISLTAMFIPLKGHAINQVKADDNDELYTYWKYMFSTH